MRKKFIPKPVRLLSLYLGTLLFLLITDPTKLPSFLLIVPFMAIFMCFYVAIVEMMHFFRTEEDGAIVGMQVRRPRLLAAVIAGFPTLLLILQSVVRLTFWDVLIAVGIFLLVYLYVSRSTVSFRKRSQRQ